MDEDNNPDRLTTDSSVLPSPQNDNRGSISLGGAPSNGTDTTVNGDGAGVPAASPVAQADPNAQIVQDVVNSDVIKNITKHLV